MFDYQRVSCCFWLLIILILMQMFFVGNCRGSKVPCHNVRRSWAREWPTAWGNWVTLQLGPMGFDADHKPEVQVVASSYVSVCFRICPIYFPYIPLFSRICPKGFPNISHIFAQHPQLLTPFFLRQGRLHLHPSRSRGGCRRGAQGLCPTAQVYRFDYIVMLQYYFCDFRVILIGC